MQGASSIAALHWQCREMLSKSPLLRSLRSLTLPARHSPLTTHYSLLANDYALHFDYGFAVVVVAIVVAGVVVFNEGVVAGFFIPDVIGSVARIPVNETVEAGGEESLPGRLDFKYRPGSESKAAAEAPAGAGVEPSNIGTPAVRPPSILPSEIRPTAILPACIGPSCVSRTRVLPSDVRATSVLTANVLPSTVRAAGVLADAIGPSAVGAWIARRKRISLPAIAQVRSERPVVSRGRPAAGGIGLS